jgi:hypothetical protein
MNFQLPATAIFLLVTIPLLLGRSEMTQAKYACNMVELAIWDEFLSEGKDLPTSWNEIQSIQDIKRTISTQNLSTLEHINALAFVPQAPIIQAGMGISINNSNRKLFAIGRAEEFHTQKSQSNNDPQDKGRYAILVAPDNSEISSSWIPEPEAQIIFKQLKGFDPTKQSLAFDKVEQLKRDIREKSPGINF